MHPVKRRKLEEVNATLTKPFRSPLRVNLVEHSGQTESKTKNSTSPLKHLQSSNAMPTLPSSSAKQLSQSKLSVEALQFSNMDPEYTVLYKQYMALSRQLTQLRMSLDTAQQALKIESTNQPAELNRLIKKWRTVAREATEDLYATAQHRINGSGGAAKFFRNNKSQDDDSWFYGVDPFIANLSDEAKEELQNQREESEALAKKYGESIHKSIEVDDIEDSFTIDVMLQQLDVSLDLIGFDKDCQAWIDDSV